MKRIIHFLGIAGVLLSTSCARYRYTCVVQPPGNYSHKHAVVRQGRGHAPRCRFLFHDGPMVYIGSAISIPPDAELVGTLAISRGSEVKGIPLYVWKLQDGALRYGCNGPHPAFAHEGTNIEEFVESITDVLGKK